MPRKGLGRGLEAILTAPNAADPGPDEQVESLDVAEIHFNPRQPRSHFDADALEGLARSIARQGVIQPIVVRPREAGGYWLVAGERRLRATRATGMERIPAVVRELSDRQSLAVALVENLQREDLNAIDEARSLVCLIEEFNLTHQGVADTLGRSRETVTNTLRLLNLDSTVQQLVVERRLEMGHARALLALDPAEQGRAAQRVGEENLTVRETERLVRAMTEPRSPRVRAPVSSDPRIPERWRNRMVIVQTPKGANVRFTRVGEEELDALLAWLRQRDTVAASGDL